MLFMLRLAVPLMYGLRSGRLCTASVHSREDLANKGTGQRPSTDHLRSGTHSVPLRRPGVISTTEPGTHSVPLSQSPYFQHNHGPFSSLASHVDNFLPPGGGLEEEEFDFDAGYVISSKLSQMVANGAYSYPDSGSQGHTELSSHTLTPPTHPLHTPSQPTHPVRVKIEPGLTLPQATPTSNHGADMLMTLRVKSEPGVDLPTDSCPHSNPGWAPTIKRESDDTLPCTHTDQQSTRPSVKVKSEPGSRDKKPGVKSEDIEDSWEPPLWRVQYENICQMRRERTAPVDTHGCFMLAERDVPPHVRRYQVLVSLMLSSQTKDQITGKAMTNLKKHGLTIENILSTPREDVAKMINAVGFWQKKSDYIKRTTEILASKYNGDIPNTLKELMSLPGVGPKMANLVMDFAWGQTTGIAVDTHVHRISHRLGWMKKQTPTPEATRIALEKWLPMSEWSNLNLMMVGFGQTLCAPQRPRCEDCLNRNLCPSSLACNDATMGGLAGNFSPEALTTGKKKKKSKTAAPTKGESPLTKGQPLHVESSATPPKKRRKLKN